MAKRVTIKDEERARIVLSKERDIDRRLFEKERIDSQLEAYMREYAALGDNTTNSLDSRYWGPVRQFNIIGPACFALWPFTEHWGSIE